MMRRVGVAGSLRRDSYGGAWCAPAAEVVPGGTLLSLTPWSDEGVLTGSAKTVVSFSTI